jgi:23S rRNA G2069 N7-methylase RlmK/C1962 C5-methylase RlmI
MSNLKFLNMSRSAMEAYEPAWQSEIMDRVGKEFSDQAREVNDQFRADVLDALKNENLLAGRAIDRIARRTPRFAWIKNIGDDRGRLYDAEIDLLNLTVTFLEI